MENSNRAVTASRRRAEGRGLSQALAGRAKLLLVRGPRDEVAAFRNHRVQYSARCSLNVGAPMKETMPAADPRNDPSVHGVLRGASALTLEKILATAVDSVLVSDRELRYAYVSPSAARLLGVNPKTLVGRRWDEVHTPEMVKPWRGLAQKVVESRRPDRKSTRLNSSHLVISYAVFCLKK